MICFMNRLEEGVINMGIINVKQYLAKKAGQAVNSMNNKITDASRLSQSQLEEIEKRKDKYLTEMPNMNSDEIQRFIEKNLGEIGIEVYQDYMNKLGSIYEPFDSVPKAYDAEMRIRYLDVTKWVTDKEEKNLDKLINVYHVLSEENCNIALIYHRSQSFCKISIGIVNTGESSDPFVIQGLYKRLSEAMKGNFPGIEVKENTQKEEFGIGVPESLNDVVSTSRHHSVAVVTNLPSEKSEDFISQSMEKLLDGIIPSKKEEEYSIVLIAKPVRDQLIKQNRLYELYSALAPYASWQTNYTYTESSSENASANVGINLGLSAGAQVGAVQSVGGSRTPLYNENSSDGFGAKLIKGALGMLGRATGQYSPTNSNFSSATSAGASAGANFGASFARTASTTAQIGKNEGITQTYTNYGVQHTLELIESQLKRMETSTALGMWDFAAYVVSEDPVIANNVAHMYVALTQGEESFLSRSSITLWNANREGEQRTNAEVILRSVQVLQHPMFQLKKDILDEWLMYPALVTATTSLSGSELAKALNFPRKSVTKFPVIETVAFGRNVQTFNEKQGYSRDKISLGCIYHMRKAEYGNAVNLDVNSLASHTFITGSTGTGKSNTVYQILNQLQENGKKFLVIEPAKGEYKEVFGGYENVQVYGTNPKLMPLLEINPFSFPSSIHVLEHIDRLVEILNACWPMYAAMPAVLKDAIEQSYIKKGWNLSSSTCDGNCYPTFLDLLEELPQVLDTSLYSDDTRNDYTGALVTRVKSLTNGINRGIFCSGKEIEVQQIFENNVIIDLSRVGSVETKALIMGILIMKLQEYRLHRHEMNAPLCHVTVLEEAHNILRKTSTEQAQNSANLQGKSVEMISNAIAEMRSYGEGFIIADQAPDLLDESVIRNTNTKIILRLPDAQDRQIAGSSISLSEEQMKELAKLPVGVAAVYQNDWIQPVLCQVAPFRKDKVKPWNYQGENQSLSYEKVFKNIYANGTEKLDEQDLDVIDRWIDARPVSDETKVDVKRIVREKSYSDKDKKCLAYNMFQGKRIAKILWANILSHEEGKQNALAQIASIAEISNRDIIENIYRSVVEQIVESNQNDLRLIQTYTQIEGERRRVL